MGNQRAVLVKSNPYHRLSATNFPRKLLAATFESTDMSTPAKPHDATPEHTPDATEAIVPLIPIVLPIVGGVLMFLLAFIAVSMA